jgi:hypothetical protein
MCESLPDAEKAALSPEQKNLWKQWDSLKCEMHKCALALASQHFVGSSKVVAETKEEKEAKQEGNPEKVCVHACVCLCKYLFVCV